MFKPKQTHPKWYLWLYPRLWMLRHKPSTVFQPNWHWHYEWERPEDQQDDMYVSESLEKAKKATFKPPQTN